MPIVDLNRQQALALIGETTSTRNLLAYGIRVIRTGTFIETTRDPILTMLSIGVEKLYKLTLGLIVLDHDHRWPSTAEMKAWGHKLMPMHHKIMRELSTRTERQSRYVRELVAEVDADPVILAVIEVLDMYGRMGRFYYLDQLGDDPQPVRPDDLWQKVENVALTDPPVAALHKRAMHHAGDNEIWTVLIRALNERIATSVEQTWAMIAVCGRNHALGETGGTFGFEVHPDAVGRQ